MIKMNKQIYMHNKKEKKNINNNQLKNYFFLKTIYDLIQRIDILEMEVNRLIAAKSLLLLSKKK
jgi:uncharacterized small protein (DUF1192 family)